MKQIVAMIALMLALGACGPVAMFVAETIATEITIGAVDTCVRWGC